LLGPNGAGKTTIILMLLGLTEPSAGRVSVLGFDPARQPLRVKARVGYLPDQVGFYDELTARENLIYTAHLNGLSRFETAQRIVKTLEDVGLSDVTDHRVGTFSHGMRQRLGLADVMLKQPEMIIMDEPTQGLDPEHAHEFLQMIHDLKNSGITILLSSHMLEQVQAVCDRVGLFSYGKMVLHGTVPELGKQVLGGAYRVEIEVAGMERPVLDVLRNIPGVVNVQSREDHLEIETQDDMRSQIAQAVVQSGASLLRLGMNVQSLDAIYTKYFEEVGHDKRN
jgi:ABC-2 type transport system ATP-binding protein